MAERPESDAECDVIKDVFKAVCEPYPVVNPYSIWLSEDSFVVQEIVAKEVVIEDARMPEIEGAVVSIVPPPEAGLSDAAKSSQ